jgi:hypothetical protein
MTLSTDNRKQLGYGAGVALAAVVGILALTGQSTYGTGGGTGSAYTRSTPALHGQSLATYLSSHYDDRVEREERDR